MKADFNEDGGLIIYTENNTEKFALKHWWDLYGDETKDSPVFGINTHDLMPVVRIGEAGGISNANKT